MKKVNKYAIITFSLIGLVAPYGVLFAGATWHIGTLAGCLTMVWVSLADNKREDKENSKSE